MKKYKQAFTLLEVLISIMLLSLVLMALYKSADILRASNKNLFHHLEHSSDAIKGISTLYKDILQADNNITINDDKKFHKITINNTMNSLYGLYKAKVTWLVYKENNTLLRIEGSEYNLPLKREDLVAIDKILTKVKLFKSYKNEKNNKVLVLIKSNEKEIQSVLIQNRNIVLSQKELHLNPLDHANN